MSYLVSQLWLCLLLALLFGGLVGWFLRGGCKAKLTKIRDDWEQRYTLLEDEKNSFVSKAQDSKRLNNERKSLLSRLTAMESGANVASSVLKENKDKLDETENRLATIKQELQQRDKEINALKKNSDDASETLNLMMDKSTSDEEKSVEIQSLLDIELSESKTTKLQFDQDISNKNKEVETLVKELKIAQEESKSNYDQLETLQALLDAHEEGSNTLSEESDKLSKALSFAENLNIDQQKQSTELSSQFDLKEKKMQEANLALKTEVEDLKNSMNSSQEEVSRLLKESLSYEEKATQTQDLLGDQAKDLASYKLEAEKNKSKQEENLKQKNSELLKLTETLEVAKEDAELKSKESESLQVLLNEQKENNKTQSDKEDGLKKALSLSDKLNVDYEKKSSDFVSQLALKEEKLKEVESELDDTKKQLDAVEPQVTQIKTLIHEYEKSSQDMLGKLSLLESQSDAYRVELRDAESKLKATQERLEHKEKEASDEFSDLKLKLQASDDEAQLIKNDLSNSESKIIQSNKEKNECDKEVTKLKGRLDSKEAEVNNLTVDLKSSQKKLKTSETEKKEIVLKLVDDGSKLAITSSQEDSAKKKIIKPTKIVESISDEKKSLKPSLKPQSLISSSVAESAKVPELSNEYEIETVEGIGKAYGEKLRNLNISTTTDLLNKATSSADIHNIANKLKQQSWVVRSWVSMSDLLRVDGVDGQYAELLEFSGIHSVQSLAKQTANPLSKKMYALNEKEHRVKIAPKSATVAEWIIYATTLNPRLTDNLESIQKEIVPKASPEKSESLLSEVKNKLSNTQKNDYDIEEIDGIGKGYGRRLRAMGIHTTTKLLNKCENTNYEKNIAQAMTLNEKLVKSWCQMADLIRVEGVDGQLADLLFFSGITSTKELSIQDVNKLTSKIESVNKAQQRMKETPTKEMVALWVASSKTLCKL